MINKACQQTRRTTNHSSMSSDHWELKWKQQKKLLEHAQMSGNCHICENNMSFKKMEMKIRKHLKLNDTENTTCIHL